MPINKFLDEFTYYDILSNLLPGLVFLWALSTLGPLPQDAITLLVTDNTIADTILLVALSYVVGHVLQFLSRFFIEPLLKIIFWKGQFFSDIFLIKIYKQCSDVELTRFISFSEEKLKFSKEDLSVLFDLEVISNETKKKKAIQLSRAIFRLIDAKTQDLSIAQKAHLQNTFYSFFRNLSVLFLILGIADLMVLILGFFKLNGMILLLISLNFTLSVIFLLQAKRRGELYVKGLFRSFI